MSKFIHGSSFAVIATIIVTLIGADGSRAVAQDHIPVIVLPQPTSETSPVTSHYVAHPVIQQLPAATADEALAPDSAADAAAVSNDIADADSLAGLVDDQPQPEALSRELQCLAGAIYFEAKGETLPGQLAVGRVIVARSRSGRFPASYCGVVYQRSQFSFVRGQSMPAIRTASRDWHEAVAIAEIAHQGSWRSPVEGALFFHAARVTPRWNLTRIARIDNHVFYR